MDETIDAVEPPGVARPGQTVSISTHAIRMRWLVTSVIDRVENDRLLTIPWLALFREKNGFRWESSDCHLRCREHLAAESSQA